MMQMENLFLLARLEMELIHILDFGKLVKFH